MNNSPWLGLKYGAIDARRVSKHNKYDFFWIVTEDRSPALLLLITDEVEEIHPLPKIKSLDIRYRNIPTGRGLVIRLLEPSQIQLFATLCEDVVEAAEEANTCQQALKQAVVRTLRWHYLLRGGKSKALSLEEQRGLVGELDFLSNLVSLIGARAAIDSWKGPERSAKDFEMPKCCVEVKARRVASRPFVKISSEHQLADVPNSNLFLMVYNLDSAMKPNGATLTDKVKALNSVFEQSDMECFAAWEAAISSTGFSWRDDYSDRRWCVHGVECFKVGAEFPRITIPPHEGISDIKYTLSLSACEPFKVPLSQVEETVIQGFADDKLS